MEEANANTISSLFEKSRFFLFKFRNTSSQKTILVATKAETWLTIYI